MFLKQNVGPNPVEGPKTGIRLPLFKMEEFRSNRLHALIKKKITVKKLAETDNETDAAHTFVHAYPS